MNYSLSTTSHSEPAAQILRNLNAGPSPKACQTILYLKLEIKPFSLLSTLLFMFFRSRIDASHTGVIGHTVYRQHVRRGPGINRMGVGITAQIVEAGDHLVLESFVHHILGPEVSHAVLDPLKVRHGHAAGIRQNIGNHKHALLMKYLVRSRSRGPIGPFS